MHFLLQTVNGQIEQTEVFELRRLLDSRLSRFQHNYDLIDSTRRITDMGLIPVGDLDFVGEYLKEAYGIDRMKPIEVPERLRKERYLKREYRIATKEEVLNETGLKFIKKIDRLKEFNNSLYGGHIPGNLEDGTYLISGLLDIVSEYRVFVLDDEIVACQYYLGNCLVFPDASKINEMIMVYTLDIKRPRAYTLDVAVTRENETVILEVHPFVSCGTYGFVHNDLIYMYRLGLDYYIKGNR